jgi:hypothetical protein
MKSRIFTTLCFGLLFFSCKKSDTTTNSPDPGSGTGTNNVSGKIKRVIASYVGSRKADIVSLEYDAANRVSKYNEWTEDSSFTPIKITQERYCSFSYNGAGLLPIKNIITKQLAGTDSTLYFYDAQDKVIKEDFYKGSSLSGRNTYAYLTAVKIIRTNYYSSGSGLQTGSRDSLVFDAQNRILESYNTLSSSTDKDSYVYDVKSSPFSSLNVFKNIFTLYIDDRKFNFRSPNNLITYKNTVGASEITVQNNLNYSSNSFPVSGTSMITSGAASINYLLKYEYY